jgi:hypothetical protein
MFGGMFHLFSLYYLFSLSLDIADFGDLQELEDQDFEQQLARNTGK